MKEMKENEVSMDDFLNFLDTLGEILEAIGIEVEAEEDADDRPAEPKEKAQEPAACDPGISCSDCERASDCLPFGGYEDEDTLDYGGFLLPDVIRITFNDPATVVHWSDGTKTVVKCMEGEKFERYAGFAAACMKKLFGSTSAAKAVMDACDTAQIEKAREAEREAKEKEKLERKLRDEKEFRDDFRSDVAAEIYRRLVMEEADRAMDRPDIKKLRGLKDEPSA